MKKLKVFFNPGVHPQFDEIINFPPENVEYLISRPTGDHNDDKVRKKRERVARFHATGIPRMFYYKQAKNCDLIHSTRAIIPLNRKPWILDLESGAAFTGLSWDYLKNPLAQTIIKFFLSSKYCKKIIPQSESAKRSLLENVDCSKFKDKIETVYLAWHTNKLERKKRRKTDPVRISFIGKGFYEKGGKDLHDAFKILNKKYPGKLKLKYKGDVPETEKLNLPNVYYLPRIEDQKEFYNEVFGDCDIYVQPTTVDSWGVSILEAMSTGLPIVCTDDKFTLPELVQNGYNGFLVKNPGHFYEYRDEGNKYIEISKQPHPETVKDLVEKISILVEDEKLRKKMGENSFKLVESGKFSIKERNKKLRRIYDESLN